MSMPVTFCVLSKAALGDEKAYTDLLETTKYNMKYGHFCQFPCKCNPPCKTPSVDQMKVLNDRLNKDMEGMVFIPSEPSGPEGTQGEK